MNNCWLPIKGYEGLYEINTDGIVRSLIEIVHLPNGGRRVNATEFLQPAERGGYLHVNLYNNGERKTHRIHHLVWDTFGTKNRNGRKLVIDHIDNNKSNNSIENLQLLTAYQNIKKHHLTTTKRSKFVGVTYHDCTNKWVARTTLDGVRKYLGLFDSEIQAFKAIINARKIVEST